MFFYPDFSLLFAYLMEEKKKKKRQTKIVSKNGERKNLYPFAKDRF